MDKGQISNSEDIRPQKTSKIRLTDQQKTVDYNIVAIHWLYVLVFIDLLAGAVSFLF